MESNLEQQILISAVHYPKNLEEFVSKVSPKTFSKNGKEILNIILDLKAKNTLNIDTLLESLPNAQHEYFTQMLSAEPNPNFLAFSEIFKESYLLKTQKEIGNKLINASDSKQLLDFVLLEQDMQISAKEYKNLNVWADEYAKKPQLKPYKTNIPFVDNCFGGGFTLGQLMLVFGDPEAGKTMFSLQILENLSKITKVCFFCFEFTIDDYLKRRANSNFVESDNFFIINEGYDIFEVANNIKNLYRQGVRFFLIDSQMRVTNSAGRNSEEEESQKFSILARLCHSLGVFVIFICQNSKTDKDNPLGSKKGGHEASIIIHIERTKPKGEDMEQKGKDYDENARIFKIKKNKQTGKHYKDRICFDAQNLRFFEEFEREKEVEIVYEYDTIKDFLN